MKRTSIYSGISVMLHALHTGEPGANKELCSFAQALTADFLSSGGGHVSCPLSVT